MTTNAPKATPATPRRFYLAMSLLMLALVTYGFSHTIGPGLLHTRRPVRDVLLLSIHGAVFYGWMLLMVAQAAVVRLRHINLHRLLGWFGATDAALVVIMGLWASFHQPAPLAAEMIGVVSMAGFGIPGALAILWRKRPASHRRLLLIGTAMLTNAAFARFPEFTCQDTSSTLAPTSSSPSASPTISGRSAAYTSSIAMTLCFVGAGGGRTPTGPFSGTKDRRNDCWRRRPSTDLWQETDRVPLRSGVPQIVAAVSIARGVVARESTHAGFNVP